MSKLVKITSTALAAAVLAGGILTSAAMAAPVQPQNSILSVSKNGCPAQFTLMAKVRTGQPGHVQIRFQRDDGATSAPVWVYASKKHAVYKRKLPAAPVLTGAKYRAIAVGAGAVEFSPWRQLKSDC